MRRWQCYSYEMGSRGLESGLGSHGGAGGDSENGEEEGEATRRKMLNPGLRKVPWGKVGNSGTT